MKLNSNNISSHKYHHISYNRILPRYNPNFGSSNLFISSNPHTDKAFETSKKLLNEMQNRILSVIDMGKISGVETKILPPFYSSVSAYTSFKPDFLNGTLSSPIIVTPLLERQDKIGKTIYIMCFAHELTHKYQIDNKEDPLSQMFKDTVDAGFKLREIDNDFEKFTRFYQQNVEGELMKMTIHKLLGNEGLEEYRETGGMVFSDTIINETQISNALGYKDKEDFISNFVEDNVPFDGIVETICTRNPILARKCVDSPTQIKSKIKTILIKYFRNSMQSEKEARLTETKIANLQNFDDKVSKCTHLYYAMAEEAFEHYLQNSK